METTEINNIILPLVFTELLEGGFTANILNYNSISAYGDTLEEAEEDFYAQWENYHKKNNLYIEQECDENTGIRKGRISNIPFHIIKEVNLLERTKNQIESRPELRSYFTDFLLRNPGSNIYCTRPEKEKPQIKVSK